MIVVITLPVMGTNYHDSSYKVVITLPVMGTNYHDSSYNYFATTFEKVVITTS